MVFDGGQYRCVCLQNDFEMYKHHPYLVQEVVSAQNGGAMIGASKVGHIAHLAGAMVGVVLILVLTRIPEPNGKQLP